MAGAGDARSHRSNAGWAFTDAFTSLWLIFADAAFSVEPSVHPYSSWIGLARAGRSGTGLVTLYLFSYYLGSSIAGTLGGVFWHSYGWNGVGGFIALMLVLTLSRPGRGHRSRSKRNNPAIATCAIAGLVSRHDSLFTIDPSGF
ncbi:hypothetical protein KCP75_07950 [Salmonella enterica subsp. enterica]|nr:hypothetical protein KCP75_07950 [Salmonella enterica subsp. enterica]